MLEYQTRNNNSRTGYPPINQLYYLFRKTTYGLPDYYFPIRFLRAEKINFIGIFGIVKQGSTARMPTTLNMGTVWVFSGGSEAIL
jgi:hypothetical protein